MPDEYHHLDVAERDNVLVLTIRDETVDDWDQSEAIRKEMVDAYTLASSDKVVVNLQNIRYMSSVGYGPFLSLKSRVSQTGGRMILCGLSETVEKVFKVTRLLISPRSTGSVFESSSDVDSAISTLGAATDDQADGDLHI